MIDLDAIDGSSDLSTSYNDMGWETLIHYLNKWGVDTSEFLSGQAGDTISAATCRWVSFAFADHMDDLPVSYVDFYKRNPEIWLAFADAGGCVILE